MASLKKLEIINKVKTNCIDEPINLEKKPLSVKEWLKLTKQGKSGLDMPELDFILGPDNKNKSVDKLQKELNKALNDAKGRMDFEKKLIEIKAKNEPPKPPEIPEDVEDKEVEGFVPDGYVDNKTKMKIMKYFNRLKQIIKRIFDSVISIKEKDIQQMYIDSFEIIDGLSKGGAVKDIFKRKHIKSIGLLFVFVAILTILIKFTY